MCVYVCPQIIARIHTNNATVRQLIHSLLVKIGKHHPQALMYPLLVATKSQSQGRRAAAYAVSCCFAWATTPSESRPYECLLSLTCGQLLCVVLLNWLGPLYSRACQLA